MWELSVKTPWLLFAIVPPSSTYKVWRWYSGEFETFDKAREKAVKFCGETSLYDIMNLVTGQRPELRYPTQNLESITIRELPGKALPVGEHHRGDVD